MHGGLYTGPEFGVENRSGAESPIKRAGLFIVRKLAEVANLAFWGTSFSDKKKGGSSPQGQSTAFGGSAPKDFEVIATPRKVEMTGGSLVEGESVFLHGVQRPQDPMSN